MKRDLKKSSYSSSKLVKVASIFILFTNSDIFIHIHGAQKCETRLYKDALHIFCQYSILMTILQNLTAIAKLASIMTAYVLVNN